MNRQDIAKFKTLLNPLCAMPDLILMAGDSQKIKDTIKELSKNAIQNRMDLMSMLDKISMDALDNINAADDPNGCCMVCEKWSLLLNAGMGECRMLNINTNEEFYCSAFNRRKG